MQKLFFICLAIAWGCAESGFTSTGAERSVDKGKKERRIGDDADQDQSADANKKKSNDDGEDGDDSDGKGGSDDKDDSDLGNADGNADLIVDSGGDVSKPDGFIETESGEKVIRADYTACVALPSSGKRGYGKCEDNSVVVIVNDGKAQEMTCCPLGGKNILSSKSADKHIQRTGTCQANEVLTGMSDPQAPSGFCSKINDKYLKLSTPVPSEYVKGNAPGILGQIAKSYNVSDTCICPEGTVAIGGHTAQDNRCNEQCVKIEEKK